MSTKVAMLTIVAALALTAGVGSAQGTNYDGLDLTGWNFTDLDETGSTFVGATLDGTIFVRTILTGADFTGADFANNLAVPTAVLTDADIAGAKFDTSNLVVAQLTTTGTWTLPTPMVLGDHNYYTAGFDPRGLNAVLGAPALVGEARSLNGVTLSKGMDLTAAIPVGAYLDFRGTDFNDADLAGVDLQFAAYDRQTVLLEAGNPIEGTTVYVNGVLGAMAGPLMVPVADASVLVVRDWLELIGPGGLLVLDGGTLAVDPGDQIQTNPLAFVPNGIRVGNAAASRIEVSRDVDVDPANPGTQFVVDMPNPIYGGGPTISILIPGGPPAWVPVPTELSIESPSANSWGVLSLTSDVTFEGLLSIDSYARVELIGDYIPGGGEAGVAVQGGGVLMGTGAMTLPAGIWPGSQYDKQGNPKAPGPSEIRISGGGTFAPGMIVQSDILGPQTAPDYAIGGKMTINAPVKFPDYGNNTFLVMVNGYDDPPMPLDPDISTGMTVNNDVVFEKPVGGESRVRLDVVTEDGSGYYSDNREYLVVNVNTPGFQITNKPVLTAVNSAMLTYTVRMEETIPGVPDQMWLDVTVGDATAFAANHNQRAIANAMNNVNVAGLPAAEQQDARDLLGALQALQADDLRREMQLLAGVEGPNNMMATLQTIRGITDRTNDYLYQLRRVARKEKMTGSLRNNTELVAVDEAADADAAAALQAMSYDWHMRADAIGIWGNVDRDGSSGSYGYSYNSYGFNLAIERMFAPNLIAGATLAGFTTDLDGKSGSGDAESDTLFVDLHATYTMGDFYVNAALGYARSCIDTHRHVIGGRRPDGSTESNYYAAGLELGYNFDLEAVNIEPYLRMDYAHARTDGWNEHNGGAANTKWSAMTHDSFRTSLGARVEVPFSVASMPARVRGDLAWEHEFADTQADASGRFLAVPINVRSADLGNDALRMGVEMEVDITENISLSGGYQFRGNHDWDQHMANLTLKCAW